MKISRGIETNLYINGRRKEDAVNTDLVSEMGNVSVTSQTLHSMTDVRKHIPVHMILKEGSSHVFINYC
jgi:hypothetical protein